MRVTLRRCVRSLSHWMTALCLGGFVPAAAFAQWIGPTDVIVAPWGSAAGQVGLERGDVEEYDAFPSEILLAPDGSIVLPDPVNRRILVYRVDGTLTKAFGPQGLDPGAARLWPGTVVLLRDGSLVTKVRDILQRYDLAGNLLASAEGVLGSLEGLAPDGSILVHQFTGQDVWQLYSPSDLSRRGALGDQPTDPSKGRLVRRLRITTDAQTGRTTTIQDLQISFPDRIFTIADFRGQVFAFFRDDRGGLYIETAGVNPSDSYTNVYPSGAVQVIQVPHSIVSHYDSSGQLVASLHLPANDHGGIVQANPGDMTEPRAKVLYGRPVPDAQANIYLSRRDSVGLRILKWTRSP